MYGQWYATGGEAGVEPTGDIRRLQILWDELKTVVDRDEQIELYRQIYDLHAEHCWLIGTVGEVPRPIVVNADLRNVPDVSICSWTVGYYLGLAQMEQWFYGD
jgi:peptide/nickel transport system substrate-binding protein